MTRAETIANDPRVTVAARIAQFATPVIVTVAIAIIGWVLTGQAAERNKLDLRVTTIEQRASSIDTRVTVLENTVTSGRSSRDKQISDINQRIDANQNSVEAKLDKITDSLTVISNQVSGLAATISATATRRP